MRKSIDKWNRNKDFSPSSTLKENNLKLRRKTLSLFKATGLPILGIDCVYIKYEALRCMQSMMDDCAFHVSFLEFSGAAIRWE